TARHYFHQLIAGVHYCHSRGFAHRDLKPENMLLDANGTLKISDFGLSNRQQDFLLETVCGTPNYVAPEVLMERGYNGMSADIWSCGVVLYVMLAGHLPFEDRTMNALLAKIERGEYQMVRHVSDAVKDLIARMLTVDPKKRITMEGIIAHPWFQVGWEQVSGAMDQRVDLQRHVVINKSLVFFFFSMPSIFFRVCRDAVANSILG
ncbi:putative serine/threonine protein kinase, partial [Trypanosoma rangeli]